MARFIAGLDLSVATAAFGLALAADEVFFERVVTLWDLEAGVAVAVGGGSWCRFEMRAERRTGCVEAEAGMRVEVDDGK